MDRDVDEDIVEVMDVTREAAKSEGIDHMNSEVHGKLEEGYDVANEKKKDFNAMLHDSKDMPKFQTITDRASIEKYGGDRVYFAPPIDYDAVMKRIPCGKLTTVGKIREYFAKQSGADFTEPITAGIYHFLQ